MLSVKVIPYVNLSAQWNEEKEELLPIVEEVLAMGGYVGGEKVEQFESEVAQFCNSNYAVALNSGTDALICALRALKIGPGSEVITPPNSFIASTSAITHVGAKPVFVDVLPDQNMNPDLVESAITPSTRAIMPVHLTGRMAEMVEICDLADHFGLYVIEDAAQAIGSLYNDCPSGSIGNVGCFSTHPLKNLNACGDGGFITTNDHKIAEKIRLLRNHGLADRNTVTDFGVVSRMDVLQAEILRYRLGRLPSIIKRRRENASVYRATLDSEYIYVPMERKNRFDSYHTFVIQTNERDALQKVLKSKGVETAIHYPVPIHLQPACKYLGHRKGDFPVAETQADRILTIPIHQYLQVSDLSYVSKNINKFFKRKASE